jgi:hypothetical protein
LSHPAATFDEVNENEIVALMTPGDDVERILAGLLRRPDWHTRAACRGVGPDAFFPAPNESTATATALCERHLIVARQSISPNRR